MVGLQITLSVQQNFYYRVYTLSNVWRNF